MTQFIVYCIDIKSYDLEIISIENSEKDAKMVQNNYSFNLLCELNKKHNLYRLEVKNNTIQIIEVSINIYKGWISDQFSERKNPIYEVGVKIFEKKEKQTLPIPTIPTKTTLNETKASSLPINIHEHYIQNIYAPIIDSCTQESPIQSYSSISSDNKVLPEINVDSNKYNQPKIPLPPKKIDSNVNPWEQVLGELKKRRNTINQ